MKEGRSAKVLRSASLCMVSIGAKTQAAPKEGLAELHARASRTDDDKFL